MTIYILYCLIKTHASHCAFDMGTWEFVRMFSCVCVWVREHVFYISIITWMLRSQLTDVPPGLFHPCGIEGQLIWSSLQPTTTAKQFEALKPAVTFF